MFLSSAPSHYFDALKPQDAEIPDLSDLQYEAPPHKNKEKSRGVAESEWRDDEMQRILPPHRSRTNLRWFWAP